MAPSRESSGDDSLDGIMRMIPITTHVCDRDDQYDFKYGVASRVCRLEREPEEWEVDEGSSVVRELVQCAIVPFN